MHAADYPDWAYYPPRTAPPDWARAFVDVVARAEPSINSTSVSGLTSDAVLGHLRPGLEALGYQVESGKALAQKIRRPVLFGEKGVPVVTYEVDAVHDELGVLVEVEAGRGARGNAVFRDLIRASLIVNARFLAVGVMRTYHHLSGGRPMEVPSYRDTRDQIDAIYASGRLTLPFEGILLFGY